MMNSVQQHNSSLADDRGSALLHGESAKRALALSFSLSCFIGIFLFLTSSLAAQSFSILDHKALLGELHYSARVGSTVVTEGDSFRVMVIPEEGRLRSVQVSVARAVVHGLRFVYTDAQGLEHTKTVGPDDGNWQPPFRIPADRQLVGISGAAGWWIDAVRFHLDDGTTSPRYGGGGGDTEFSLLLAQRDRQWKGRLMGFWGTAGDHVESIGLVFWPIE